MLISYKDWIPRVLSVANEAANAILDIYNHKSYQVKSKLDNSPVTEADLVAHRIIEQGLLAIDSTLPIISEEGETIPFEVRSGWHRFWLVDPLDGTQEFIQGANEFTTNIALIEDHLPILGVVVAPALQCCYWAFRGAGAYAQIFGKEANVIHTQAPSLQPSLKVAVSRRYENIQPAWTELIKRLGKFEFIYCGSALKICLVAKGEAHLYPRLGSTSEWDTAAGQCILEAAGGQLIDLRGHTLRYNMRPTLENPGFYAISDASLIPLCCG